MEPMRNPRLDGRLTWRPIADWCVAVVMTVTPLAVVTAVVLMWPWNWALFAIAGWWAVSFTTWAARKLLGPLIMEWLVPSDAFPRRLTLGDDWRTLADWAHIHYAYDNGVWTRRP